MSNVIDELEKFKHQRLSGQEQIVDNAKLLLSATDREEREILSVLGLDVHIREVEKNVELGIKNENYTKEYEGKIFHFKEIEKFALKYRLYLRPADKYRGIIPPDLGAVILRLKKKHNLNINSSDNSDKGKFYILAPPQFFNDYTTPMEKVKDVFRDKKNGGIREGVREFLASLKDPMMLYSIDGEHFSFLKKWGNDFSIFRAMLGFLTKSIVWSAFGVILSYFCIIKYGWKACRLLIGYIYTLPGSQFYINMMDLLCFILYVIYAAVIIASTIIGLRMIFSKKRLYSLHNFITPTNWSKNKKP